MLRDLFISKAVRNVPVDSDSFFKIFWMCWKLMGIGIESNKWYIWVYDIMVNLFITIFYPIHLTIGLFLVPTLADVFKNLTINITDVTCSVKHYLFRYKLGKIRKLQGLLKQLDQRVVAEEERDYFHRDIRIAVRNIMCVFCISYFADALASTVDVLTKKERELMYPAWFPFDWAANRYRYYAAVFYQIFGVSMQITQNLAHDTFAPISLCVMSGQVRLLAMRVSRIGYDKSKSRLTHERELNECIEDHKILLRSFDLLQDIFWYTQMVQFSSVGLNICMTVVFMLLFVDNLFGYVYYSVYFFSMAIELLPACYYGSKMQEEFQDLPYAIFRCNWLEQRKSFQQNLRIFTELSRKQLTPTAGGIINIHLTSFVATCKSAYSLYTVLMNMK
ncbi:odorant receptor 33b-like [Anastrepha ludens]|uniref:Odorant receptor n=1 Tax=Anastrepha ludens TaxID=28586 RepID=A0A9E8DAG3_9MUSC|nr:odorant receptor 33b-like [Anastrepha ludens]UZH23389.1 odorant receptor 33ab1 [Anastrepha ludens]